MIQYSARQLARTLILDILAVWLALLIAEYLRRNLTLGMMVDESHWITPPLLYVIAPMLWVISLYTAKVYDQSHNLTSALKIGTLALGQLGASLLFSGVLYITFRDYSRLQTIYLIVVSFILLAAHRLIYDRLYQRGGAAARGSRVLIVGTDETARRFGEVMMTRQPASLKLVGYIARDAEPDAGLNAPVLGSIDDLLDVIRRSEVTELVVSIHWFDQQTSQLITRILGEVEALPVNVRLAPDYSDFAYFHTSIETLFGMPLIGIREPVFTPSERIVKRALDIVLSALALIVCLPLFALIALAIRLDSPGPVLLRQTRVGYHERLFKMFKFRSMIFDPSGQAAPEHPFNVVKVRDDPRITRVGAILRRTSFDELPQFYNVLIGDMSLVGPRPEIPGLVSQYAWWQRKRFEVPQGMTGWWQINGRADRPMYFHTGDDLFYIRNYSIWLDLWILFRTVFVVILGRGAY